MSESINFFGPRLFPKRFAEKKLSGDPGFHVFCLLLGFFLGNLSPQGIFLTSFGLPGFDRAAQQDWTQPLDKENHDQTIKPGTPPVSWQGSNAFEQKLAQRANLISIEALKTNSTFAEWTFEKINNFPGPAPTILLVGEILNWLTFGFRFQSEQGAARFVERNPTQAHRNSGPFTTKVKQTMTEKKNRKIILGLGSGAAPKDSNALRPNFFLKSLLSLRNFALRLVQGASLDKLFFHRSSFTRCFNSGKVGFFLGIFVDAFKVGS